MKKLITSLLLLVGLGASAQVKVGDNVTTLAPGSLFEMESTNKGLLLPRVALTNTTAILPVLGTHAQATGMAVYNTATAGDVTPGIYSNDGTKWVKAGGATTTAFRVNLGQASSTSYDWTANSNFDFYEFTSGTLLTLPTPVSYTSRTIYLRNLTGGNLTFLGTNGIGTPKGITSLTSSSALTLYSDGTSWHLVSGR